MYTKDACMYGIQKLTEEEKSKRERESEREGPRSNYQVMVKLVKSLSTCEIVLYLVIGQ